VAAVPPAVRTPVQAQAARKNGAKSRGPRTAAGKQKSSRNATRHGILARAMAPLADDRNEERDYHHQMKQLIREYEPQTITEFNWVEVLAFESIKLGRCAQMHEVTATVDRRIDEGRASVPDLEEAIEVVDRLIRRLRRRQRLDCSTDDLTLLVSFMRQRVD